MPRRLLVASIGNPTPYLNTLHSAGHTLLESVREFLSYPPLTVESSFSSGRVSHGSEYTLYQSRSMMNVSGDNIAKAYRSFLKTIPIDERGAARLVVLHDELEAPLGALKMKIGGSARGHNGLKSILHTLGGKEFVRIGIGIGRPESRESKDVAYFVLRKMKPVEMQKVQGSAEAVVKMLEGLKED